MVSFIISFYQADAYRRRNLDYIVANLKQLNIPNSEVIVVEQDSVAHYKTDDPFVVNVFIQSNSMFNKGLGYNKGASIAKNDILFFNDADIVMDSQLYFNAIDNLRNFDVVDPYRRINYADEKVSVAIINGITNTTYIKTIISGVITGGAFAIRKNVFLESKGFDEHCVGYGYEDTILDTKLTKLGYRICRTNDSCIHLYHPSPVRSITCKRELNEFIAFAVSSDGSYYSNFVKNKKLFEMYESFTKEELLTYINKQ